MKNSSNNLFIKESINYKTLDLVGERVLG